MTCCVSILNAMPCICNCSVHECKVMSSKMKPLWLTWKNRWPSCQTDKEETVKYIVKDGDGMFSRKTFFYTLKPI